MDKIEQIKRILNWKIGKEPAFCTREHWLKIIDETARQIHDLYSQPIDLEECLLSEDEVTEISQGLAPGEYCDLSVQVGTRASQLTLESPKLTQFIEKEKQKAREEYRKEHILHFGSQPMEGIEECLIDEENPVDWNDVGIYHGQKLLEVIRQKEQKAQHKVLDWLVIKLRQMQSRDVSAEASGYYGNLYDLIRQYRKEEISQER